MGEKKQFCDILPKFQIFEPPNPLNMRGNLILFRPVVLPVIIY